MRGGSSPATLDELEDDQEPYTVLYSYAIWLIGRVEFDVPVDALREVMARWFFMSQITGRYTNSPETRIQEDISRIAGFTSTEPGWPARRAPLIDFRRHIHRHRRGDVDPFAWEPWPAIEERGARPHL
jgi:hypothetical protein